ncbi:MAG: hypothetical protein ACXW3D_07905, partial [Caulobacteraceae bacterium]
MTPAQSPACRRRPPEVWDRARADYQSGFSGPEVCERYGMGLSTLRARALAEGWRRLDQIGFEPISDEDEDDGEPAPGPEALAARVWAEAARAVRRRRVREAREWTRLWRELQSAAEIEIEAARQIARAPVRADAQARIDRRVAAIQTHLNVPRHHGEDESDVLDEL